MFPNDLLDYLQAVPFAPFRIHMTDGTMYEIRHPELVKVEPTKARVYFPKDDVPHSLVLRKESIALLHINRLAPISQPAPTAQQVAEGNGTPS